MLNRIQKASPQLLLFLSAAFSMGIAYSMIDSTFNNFINEKFPLSAFQRSFLEFPRELPGFLVVFVSAALWFLCSRRLGGLAMLLGAAGALLIGFASSSYGTMVIWLFVYSMGQHLIMPVTSAIGMEMAREGQTGRRLGQLNSIRNLAAILGSTVVALGFRYLGFNFHHTFVIAAVAFVVAAALFFSMRRETATRARTFLTLHKEYRLFYTLGAISGARRQLFLTFAPWVLVKVLEQPTSIMATLYTLGGVIGVLFQPLLGRAIDRLGERRVLSAEAVVLVFVCLGYAFARDVLPPETAFLAVCAFFLIDQMIFSVSMARATYLKKIARSPEDIQPALTASVTIDHIFSIGAALLGGLVWNAWGFQYVFLFGVGIALLNLVFALRVRLPQAGN
jgi:predicted MFS family arabinose efflux permease